jgi:RNA polymerase sigma-70 factor (ECF subfamily)
MTLSRDNFQRLALAEVDSLYRVARRLTRESAAAHDLVQETYLRAFRAAHTFHLQEFGIRPWLLRIMNNLFITRGERDKRQPRGMGDEFLSKISDPHSAPAHSSELFDGLDEHLAGALEDLPHEYQQVLLLWAVEELSYKEISMALDIPIGTVMSRLHRARERLSIQLRDYARRERLIRE